MKYKYLRVKISLSGYFHYNKDGAEMSPREAIEHMAFMGYRYVGNVPVRISGSNGIMAEYDMIFEKGASIK